MGLDKGLNTVVKLDHVYFLFIVCYGTFEVSLNSVAEHALVKGVEDSFNGVVEQACVKDVCLVCSGFRVGFFTVVEQAVIYFFS